MFYHIFNSHKRLFHTFLFYFQMHIRPLLSNKTLKINVQRRSCGFMYYDIVDVRCDSHLYITYMPSLPPSLPLYSRVQPYMIAADAHYVIHRNQPSHLHTQI